VHAFTKVGEVHTHEPSIGAGSLRPMRGLKHLSSAGTVAAGHAFIQNLRRGHYELTADVLPHHRVRAAFDELARSL
jgi:IS6 family transposase